MTFSSDQLYNGTTVITDYSPRHKAAAVHWVLRNAGARPEKRDGSAHFFEHMFPSSPSEEPDTTVSERFDEIAYENNFATGLEGIDAYAHVLPHHVPEVIRTLGRCVTTPAWGEPDLEREQSRIVIERAESDQSGMRSCFMHAMQAAYRDNHGVSHARLGTKKDILGMRREDLMEYRQDHFHGRRMALIVSGPIPHSKVMKMAEQAFRFLPAGNPGPRQEAPVFHDGQRIMLKKPNKTIQNVLLHFPSVPVRHRLHDAAFYMMALYDAALTKDLSRAGSTYLSADAYTSGESDHGNAFIYASTTPANARAVLKKAFRLAASPGAWLTKQKFAQYNERRKTGKAFDSTDPRERAALIEGYFANTGKPTRPEKAYAEANAITFADLQAAYANWDRDRFNVITRGAATDIPSPAELRALKI